MPCRCSLYSLTDALATGRPYSPGYCASVIGGPEYANAAAQMLNILGSSNCHTLDRADMRIQKASCGLGTEDDTYRLAIDSWFNVTHWPYVQNDYTYQCVSMMFADSYWNLILKTAGVTVATVATLIAVSLSLAL